jgi:asparagine synthase (glutamine-hydrolysing)
VCGIAGILNVDGSLADPGRLRSMIAAVAHRGPDGSGVHVDGPLGLAHARLAIVDLVAGAQPMTSVDGRCTITFNGEIYNYRELREGLLRSGRRLRTHSDTEVILELYLERGDACVQELNGQWAFALWDAARKRLFLSRDRLGVRPLFVARTPAAFVFGSEIKALLAHPAVPRRLDPAGLHEIFTTWTTLPPRTPFSGIDELPPGCSMAIEGGTAVSSRHWDLDLSGSADARDADTLSAELLARLDAATSLRLFQADVPVGSYLSGGLDSTTVAALARRHAGPALETFSVAFPSPEHDESRFQREAAAFLGVRHHAVTCSAADTCDAFPAVVRHAELPLLRTAPAPLYLLARRVREEGMKVVLTGEGADEVLGGYDIFKEAKLRRAVALRPDAARLPRLLSRLYPYLPGLQAQGSAALGVFFAATPAELADPLFSHLPRWRLTAGLARLYDDGFRAEVTDHDPVAVVRGSLPRGFETWHPFCRAQYLETRWLLPGYILSAQGDRMAMASGVEGRHPFLDPGVVALARALPPTLKMRALNEKYLLKKAAADLIPPSVRRRHKQPYRAPIAAVFFDPATRRGRAAWVETLLSPENLRRAAVFHPDAVSRLVDRARDGRLTSEREGMALVAVVSTQLLAAQLVEGVEVSSDAP